MRPVSVGSWWSAVPVSDEGGIGLGAADGRRVEGRLGSRTDPAPGDRGCPAGGGAHASLLQAQSQIKMLDVVTSGERAVAAVNEYKPDVVIVDALLQGRVSRQRRGAWRPAVRSRRSAW